MVETLATFTPEQLNFIGALTVTYGVGVLVLVWRAAVLFTRQERDIDNLGYIVGTKKGIARHQKWLKKQRKGVHMNMAAIWAVVSRFLPKSKIGAWLLGLLTLAVSAFLTVSPQELKEKYCAAPVVELPSAPADAPVK